MEPVWLTTSEVAFLRHIQDDYLGEAVSDEVAWIDHMILKRTDYVQCPANWVVGNTSAACTLIAGHGGQHGSRIIGRRTEYYWFDAEV